MQQLSINQDIINNNGDRNCKENMRDDKIGEDTEFMEPLRHDCDFNEINELSKRTILNIVGIVTGHIQEKCVLHFRTDTTVITKLIIMNECVTPIQIIFLTCHVHLFNMHYMDDESINLEKPYRIYSLSNRQPNCR